MAHVQPHPDHRARAVARVLWIVLGLNVAVAGTKLVVGSLAGALSLVADGVHSALDASSNVVGLVGIALASRPPDRNHPYGHQRFETMAAVLIGLLIAGGVLEIGRKLVEGHAKTHEVARALRAAFPQVADVIIHTEPTAD